MDRGLMPGGKMHNNCEGPFLETSLNFFLTYKNSAGKSKRAN